MSRTRISGLLALALAAGVSAAAVARPQSAVPSPAAAPVASGSPIPTASGSPMPATTAPTAIPTPAYKFVYRATPSPVSTPFPGPGAPEIDEIDLSDSTLVPPANIYGRVLTNAYVVAVSAETMGAELKIPQTSPGVFSLSASVPDVPAFLRNRSFDVTFAATASNGRVATVTLQLVIR